MIATNGGTALVALRVSQLDHSDTSVLCAFRAGCRFCLAGGQPPSGESHLARGAPEKELTAMLTGYDVTLQLMAMLQDRDAVESALIAAVAAVRQSRAYGCNHGHRTTTGCA